MRQLLASAVFTFGSLTSVAAFAGDADFTLVNATGYTIEGVFLAPAKKNDWGKDRLGEKVIDNNQSRLFKFSDTANCVQDLQVQFEEGGDATWENLDLCEINKLTIKYNKATKTVSVIKE